MGLVTSIAGLGDGAGPGQGARGGVRKVEVKALFAAQFWSTTQAMCTMLLGWHWRFFWKPWYNGVLDLGIEAPLELDHYGFGVRIARVRYEVLEFIYIFI